MYIKKLVYYMKSIFDRLSLLIKITSVSERRFFADIFKLSTLTAMAKIISIVTLPLLTRIYDPHAFGTLSGFVAMLGIVGAIGAFKIEYAVSLPKSLKKARYLLAASLVISLGVIALTAFGAYYIWPLFSKEPVPVSMSALFIISSAGVLYFRIFRQWLTRIESYQAIGWSQCDQSIVQMVFRIIIPFIPGISPMPGLIAGDSVGRLAMCYRVWRKSATFPILKYIKRVRVWWNILKGYRKHCITHTASALLNELPIAFFSLTVIYFYQETQAGYVSMAYQAVQAVANVLSVAVAHVFFGNITVIFHNQPNLVHGKFIRIISQLFLLILPGAILILFWGPWIFSTILGEKWATSGEYCRILLPLIVSQLIIGPTLNLLILTRRIHRQFLANACWVVSILLLTVIVHIFDVGIVVYLAAFSFCSTAVYLWQLAEIHYATKNLVMSTNDIPNDHKAFQIS